MARFNWSKTQSDWTSAKNGSESYSSEKLPLGYSGIISTTIKPKKEMCPVCYEKIAVEFIESHYLSCLPKKTRQKLLDSMANAKPIERKPKKPKLKKLKKRNKLK